MSVVEVLYGSCARGDSGADSDIDVLLLGQQPLTLGVNTAEGLRTAVTAYSWQEFQRMADYGSLFLHHLKQEGRVVGGSATGRARFDRVLSELPAYSRAMLDVSSFEMAIADVEEALSWGDTGLRYELSALATVIRHSSIVGCYLVGSPCFGRYDSVTRFVERTALDAEIAVDFPSLYQFRLAECRDMPAPEPSMDEATLWVHRARLFVKEVAAWATLRSACNG